MSFLGTIYKKQSIYLVDGVVREKTIQDFGYQVEAGFEVLGNSIGNMYGAGLSTSSASYYMNSLAKAIGDSSKVSPNEPFGKRFNSYTQSFVNDGLRKDFILDLIPDSNNPGSLTITSQDVGIVWVLRNTIEGLTSVGDYNIDGRVITFYQSPQSAFSIIYDGDYPIFSSIKNGYMPNVYPSPTLIEDGTIERPALTLTQQGRIKVTINKSNVNASGKTFGSELDLEFNPAISPYVSQIGSTIVPSELASPWIKENGSYRKLNNNGLYILSSTEFEIDTDENISLLLDNIVIAISNVSVADSIHDIFKFLINHTHDKKDITSSIDHNRLINLISVSNNPNIIYGGSSIVGNDHPQYFHREGYDITDPGTYNNAILGDVLISSIDPSSLFNNILQDSNKLIFGSTSEGASVKFRATEKDLLLFSTNNGLSIDTPNGTGKESISLSLNGHEFFDYSGNLTIHSKNGLVRIAGQDGIIPAELFSDTIDSNLSKVLNIVIKASGSISIGNNTILDDGGSLSMSGLDTFNINSKVFMSDFSGVMDIDANSGISFGGSSTKISLRGTDQASFFSTSPFAFTNSGRSTGISIESIDKQYLNIYSSSNSGGASTPSDHSTYIESGEGAVYYLRSTKTDQVKDNITFSWQTTEVGKTRVDNLRDWPKTDVHAADGVFDSITVGTSSLVERSGVSFGSLNHVYVTGGGTQCPAGWMVLESQNGVVLVNSASDPTDCQSIVYSDLTAADIQSFGSVIAESDVSAGGDVRAIGTLFGNKLEVQDSVLISGTSRLVGNTTFEGNALYLSDAFFNTDVEIKGSASVSNKLTVSNLITNGISVFNEIARFESNVDINGNLTIDGELRSSARVIIDDKIIVNEISSGPISATSLTLSALLTANGGIETSGDVSSGGNISVANNLNVNSNIVCDGTIFANKITISGDLTSSGDTFVEGSSTVRKDLTVGASGGTLTSLGETVLSGNTSISGDVNIFGKSSFNGELNVTSTVTMSSSIKVDGSATFSSSLDVEGPITSEGLTVSGQSNLNAGLIVKGLLQTQDISVNGTVNITENLNLDRLISRAGIDALSGSNSNLANTKVAGSFSQTDSNSSVDIAGETTFSKTVNISNKLEVANSVKIGSENNETIISGNSIELTGSSSQISTSNVKTGSISGNQIPNIPDVIIGNINSSIATAVTNREYITLDDAYFDGSAIFSGSAYFSDPIYITSIKRLVQSEDNLDWIDIIAKEAYYAP